MRGSIVKRGSRYHAVVDLPAGADGRRRQKWLSGFTTKREAEAALVAATAEVHSGRWLEPTAMTLEQYLVQEWLPASAARVRPGTLHSYRAMLQRYVLPPLGSVRLSEVTPVALTKLYGRLLAAGRANGRGGLSARTVRYLHTVLRKAFADAVRWRYLAVNPTDGAQAPSASAARAPEMRTWTLPELRHFLDLTAADEHHIGYLLAAACGLRRGELLGLRWGDIDLDPAHGQPVLRIRQQLVEVHHTMSFATPKTAAARRTVVVDAGTADALRRHRARQRAARLAQGSAVTRDDLIVARADGQPWQPGSFGQAFAKRVRKSGLPRIRFHDLRHTHATLALQAGVHPKIVSERLGHTSTAFTLDTYAHAVPSLQAQPPTPSDSSSRSH